MNILLRFSPETSPKIPTFRKQVRTLKMKDPVQHSRSLSLSPHPPRAFLPPFLPQVLSPKFLGPFFFLLNLFPGSVQPSWLTSTSATF